jgi:ABC-type sugar transport system permease subunit
MPVVVSGVVITILWQQLFGYDSGIINRVLTGVHF